MKVNFSARLLVAAVSLLLAGGTLHAQRTRPGQGFISADAYYTLSNAALTLSYGQYTMSGYWDAALTAAQRDFRLTTDQSAGKRFGIPVKRISYTSLVDGLVNESYVAARGGYMYRFLSLRNRLLNFYGGGHAMIGVQLIDPFGRYSYDLRQLRDYNDGEYAKLLQGVGFFYGVSADLQGEVFLFRGLALTVNLSLPLMANSSIALFGFQVGGGLRYNF